MANESIVQQRKNKQLLVTLPRAIGEAMGFRKGDTVEWVFANGALVVRKRERGRE
jgi:antitoxin component of MazEF toxin-antitoxin module